MIHGTAVNGTRRRLVVLQVATGYRPLLAAGLKQQEDNLDRWLKADLIGIAMIQCVEW